MKLIKEGSAQLKVELNKKISKDMPVFYNPVMKFNRDMTILFLNALNRKKLQISLPLSGTGIRGIRMIKELDKDKIKDIQFNDYDEKSVELIKKN